MHTSGVVLVSAAAKCPTCGRSETRCSKAERDKMLMQKPSSLDETVEINKISYLVAEIRSDAHNSNDLLAPSQLAFRALYGLGGINQTTKWQNQILHRLAFEGQVRLESMAIYSHPWNGFQWFSVANV